MTGLTLLAVGGPRHGEQLPYDGSMPTLLVPIIPKLTATVYEKRWCVHGGEVRSRTDGDVHFVGAGEVAHLYGMQRGEWRPVGYDGGMYGPVRCRSEGTCVYPDPTGVYSRHNLPPRIPTESSMTITAARYERRVVSDRAVWVYTGS